MKKLVLVVIDALRPAALDSAIASGVAPTLARLIADGHSSSKCISTFPSLTPVASSTITTGTGPDRHEVPSMNWFDRERNRYVDYGTSFPAARRIGFFSVLKDLVYNLNEHHLSKRTPTFFELLEAAGIRSACTTYMVYRGPFEHDNLGSGVTGILASAAGLIKPAYGPSELLYADIFDSLGTPCRSGYGKPGQRDQHAACVGSHLVESGSYDFMLLSMPDNDYYSHREGPEAQVVSIAAADQNLAKVINAGGGYDDFMRDHAVIVMSDHSQSPVREGVDVISMTEGWNVLPPRPPRKAIASAELAVCPAARATLFYGLGGRSAASWRGRLAPQLLSSEQIDLVMYKQDNEAVVMSDAGELRFAPGDDTIDEHGERWSVDGDASVLKLDIADGLAISAVYPDALARIWSAVNCATAGDMIATAAYGYEFIDWGGSSHAGGGSHGSLHFEDSEAQLILTGLDAPGIEHRAAWSIADVFPLVLDHFGVGHPQP